MEFKCIESMRRLASRRKALYAHRVIGALLLSALVVVVLLELDRHREHREQHYEHRLTIIKASLRYLDNASVVFFDEHGRYPISFDELRRACEDRVGKGSYYTKMYVDLTSDMTNEIPEYRELNGKGGYYYDPNSGQVRLNLTRPVEEYWPGYRGWLHDTIPSTWED